MTAEEELVAREVSCRRAIMAAEVVKAGAMVSSKRTIDRFLGRLSMGDEERRGCWCEVVGCSLGRTGQSWTSGFWDLVPLDICLGGACAITMLAR